MGMKVKEIVAKLTELGKEIELENLIDLLDNIGIEDATEETDIDDKIVKNLSAKFKVDIKGSKAKSNDFSVEAVIKKNEENKREAARLAKEKAEREAKERELAAIEAEKKKKEEKERKKKEAEEKKKAEAEEQAKRLEAKKEEEAEAESVEDDVELLHTYNEAYEEYNNDVNKQKTYTRLKNVKKKNNKNTNDRKANVP